MAHLDTPQSICQFGIARCDVTPPVGIYHRMWGAATHEKAAGVHRPLTAAALIFRAAGTQTGLDAEQVVVALDHCLLWAPEMEELTAAICANTGLEPEQLSVAFSHTHAAGLMGKERAALPGGDLIAPYLEQLAGRLAAIVSQARTSLQPATITYGTGHCALAAHRDFWDEATQQFVCGFNPDGPSDDTVLVARVTGTGGELLATIANYACHPTTLAWQNTLISPDFPGAMRETIERHTGAPCVFLQGASGDVGPREGFVGDPATADRNGRELAFAALAVFESLPPPGTQFTYMGPVVSGATLGTWSHVAPGDAQRWHKQYWRLQRWAIPLVYRPDLPNRETTTSERSRWQAEEETARHSGDETKTRDCRAMVERMDRQLRRLEQLPPGDRFPMPIVLWQMGDAFWLAVEAEHYQLLQTRLRRQFPEVAIVVMTIVNGARAAYLPTKESYGKNIYQETIAVLAAGCLEAVIEEIGQKIRSWLLERPSQ